MYILTQKREVFRKLCVLTTGVDHASAVIMERSKADGEGSLNIPAWRKMHFQFTLPVLLSRDSARNAPEE